MKNTKNKEDKIKIVHHKKNIHHPKKRFFNFLLKLILVLGSLFLVFAAGLSIYIATLTIPDFSNFADRKIDNSTRIYDRTGKILLYDVHSNIKRVQVKGDDISKYVKDATVSVEDKHFYEHHGIRPTSILRALLINLKSGSFVQGGSTIDQQIIKNALLSQNKTIIRKIKEWAMAIKLDTQVSKDDILTIYLNDASYGGDIYGIETASQYFFGKHANELDIAESAYLASLPNAPSYYSPYGSHVSELNERKDLVLKLMYDQNMISQEEYLKAKDEKVIWQKNNTSGKALHFVFYVRDYLEKKYGKDVVDTGGLNVVTTLDYDLQSKAESIIKTHVLDNAKKYHATNGALVALDVKTGQILTMVGSRDYFDTEIPGNFNVAISPRQPGSSFKPIVYATAFMKGYNPNTVLFDVKTEFNTKCSTNSTPLTNDPNIKCYSPENYDGKYRGPVTIKNALAQSLNVPAVKALYLAGVKDSINTAQKMGITSLDPSKNYGLSLVLGSGEVSLLQMTTAYTVFANEGNYSPTSFILSVTDKNGNNLETYTQNTNNVIPKNIADEINDILSDNTARTPLYGANSGLYFGDRPVADKTGTTNSYRDTWTIGYTPSYAVGVWAGNNDNTPINKQLSGMIAVPMWNEFMNYLLKDKPVEYFNKPDPSTYSNNSNSLPPVKGVYCYTDSNGSHSYSILPENDSQYTLWKTVEDSWINQNYCPF